jgi:transposase
VPSCSAASPTCSAFSRPTKRRRGRSRHGYLHVAAYAGLIRDNGRCEVARGAPARRHFYDGRTSDAAQALARIRPLYQFEDAASEEIQSWPRQDDPLPQGQQADAARLRLRQERTVPLLPAQRQGLEREQPQVQPKVFLGHAINCALTSCPALLRYTTAGLLGIDNNVSERTLHQRALGRKNDSVVGSDRDGETTRRWPSCSGSRQPAGGIKTIPSPTCATP